MNNQDLIDNLKGQEYENGYVVNLEQPAFINLRTSIKLNNRITQPRFKEKTQDSIYFNIPENAKGQANMQKSQPTVLNVVEGNFTHYEEHKQFERARRVDLQIQNRLNERMLNQIETSYAPQAQTVAELKALRTTRPELTKEIEAVEEYAKTHYVTPEQKQKLLENVYKNNFKNWKKKILGVETGTINTRAPRDDALPFPTDPRIPPIPILTEQEEKEADIIRYGDIIDLTSNLGDTQYRQISKEFLKENGEFFNLIKAKNSKTYNVLSNVLLLLTSNQNILKERVLEQLKKQTITVYFKGILQILSQLYLDINGTPLFKIDDPKKLKNLNKNSLQYNKIYTILFKMLQEIKRQIPKGKYIKPAELLRQSLTTTGTTSITVFRNDLFIKSLPLFYKYVDDYNKLLNGEERQPQQIINADPDEGAIGAVIGGQAGQ